MLKNIPPNPYYDFNAIHDPSRFFGREDQVRQLLEACDRKQNLSVTGSRHSGKTSLLNYLMNPTLHQKWRDNLQQHIFVLVDLRTYLEKTRDDFFDSVCEQIYTYGQQQASSLKRANCSGEDQFSRLLKDLHKAGFHIVLLLDAFDNIVKNRQFDANFFSFLRFPATRGWVSYITASIKPLYELVISRPEVDSPFFNIFKNCPLGPFTHDEAEQLIITPASATPYPFTPKEAEWILEQAGRHPFFLQVVCGFLFDEKCRQFDGGVDLEHVRERAYQELVPHFDQLWNDLTSEQQKNLKHELLQQSSIQYKFPELSESWLFRKRIREKFQVDLFDISSKEVKEALDNLGNLALLQECKLAETHYVSIRNKDNNASVNKKGRLVLEFLKLGFERMRPGDIRSDSAPEWRLYNILYYHYFKYHLANGQTAARLSISRRQFYREQEKALQALTKELLELEIASLNAGQA
jgi:hypothetical protein